MVVVDTPQLDWREDKRESEGEGEGEDGGVSAGEGKELGKAQKPQLGIIYCNTIVCLHTTSW